ncbi:hypothetical protein EDB83DRAFT_1361322 [Lactarius deliciosus]|nr:hypothetical protein EDB83DRAFT_1361322 [Lactarius deliciosus]
MLSGLPLNSTSYFTVATHPPRVQATCYLYRLYRTPLARTSSSDPAIHFCYQFHFSPSFNLPPTSTMVATMELLSAAQKYKMSSVLVHIRLCLAQRDSPFIHKENAFRAYSLAQNDGLRQEAVYAAKLTLKFSTSFQTSAISGSLAALSKDGRTRRRKVGRWSGSSVYVTASATPVALAMSSN